MNAFEADYKKQDVKFVEWSRDVTARAYDVQRIVQRIRGLNCASLQILDVGGGIGTFARALVGELEDASVDVIDRSPLAKDNFVSQERTSLIFDDFLVWKPQKQYDVIIFRTVLHHIVGATEAQTEAAQRRAMEKAGHLLASGGRVFVIENFYDPIVGEDITGKIIFQLTRLKTLASVFRGLGANTAGEGVRFRSFKSWERLFHSMLYEISDILRAPRSTWIIPFWQSAPLLCIDCYQALLELKKREGGGW